MGAGPYRAVGLGRDEAQRSANPQVKRHEPRTAQIPKLTVRVRLSGLFPGTSPPLDEQPEQIVAGFLGSVAATASPL